MPRAKREGDGGGAVRRCLWTVRGEETVALVGSLPEGDPPPGTWEHPSVGPLNLKELIAFHRLHVMDHVQQIEKIKADPGYPAS